jgi:hypothetical protein
MFFAAPQHATRCALEKVLLFFSALRRAVWSAGGIGKRSYACLSLEKVA